jgi:hypothetical protein
VYIKVDHSYTTILQQGNNILAPNCAMYGVECHDSQFTMSLTSRNSKNEAYDSSKGLACVDMSYLPACDQIIACWMPAIPDILDASTLRPFMPLRTAILQEFLICIAILHESSTF